MDRKSKTFKKVSVVIPTYGDNWLFISKSIISILKQTLKPFELIVVGGNMSQKITENIKEEFPEVKLLTFNKNLGVTGGRNKGLEFAKKSAEYVFFFDHDMYAHPQMLTELVKVAASEKYIGIVTPKIYYWKDRKRIWSAGTGMNLWTGQVLFRGGKDVGQFENVEEVQVAPAAMLIKREVFKKIGGFDERYFVTYEDTDFCFRAKKVGFETYYTPKAIAYHDLPTDLGKESTRLLSRIYWVGRNRIIFMKNHGKNFFVFLLFLPVFIFYYLYLSVKYKRFVDWLEFLKGTIVGLIS